MKVLCKSCNQLKDINDFVKNKSKKIGINSVCKNCHRLNVQKYRLNFKFNYFLTTIKQRCENPKNNRYHRYGGRGIKCLITEEELKFLWERDKASEMKRPSIDRKDNDGNYELSNCRYIEFNENSAHKNADSCHNVPILQYDLEGNFIKEWKSITQASVFYNCNNSTIGKNLQGKHKTSCGFIWKYKNNKMETK